MFTIIEQREFFGPSSATGLMLDPCGKPEVYETRSAADTRIQELDDGECRIAHNESSRPQYSVRHVNRLSRADRALVDG
ncbi:hypothetical protein [Aquibium microcysteis]|uniref:hypothetical protein n=1 Tax=Aquibium microcysteis TaxID=675281 RepID=UPI00165D0332|nr:hypothetical protein [Aquibium microcysteis]